MKAAAVAEVVDTATADVAAADPSSPPAAPVCNGGCCGSTCTACCAFALAAGNETGPLLRLGSRLTLRDAPVRARLAADGLIRPPKSFA
jgi:hypothetical protein